MTTAKQYDVPIVSGYFTPHSSLFSLTVLHDAPAPDSIALASEEQLFFTDLQNVFLHRFSRFVLLDTMPAEEEQQMIAMLSQLVDLKKALRQER